MKNIRPYQVTLFIFSVLLVLTPVVFFTPKEGWNLFGVKGKFLTKENFLEPKKQEKADISDVLAAIDTSMTAPPPKEVPPLIKHDGSSDGSMGAPTQRDIEVESSTELLMNESGQENLSRFFEHLSQVATKKEKISILHYGDSQIEGDRMTGFIRERIQSQFGGNGPGLIPATNVYNTYAFNQSYSESFQRFTAFGGGKLSSRKYGALASASRFTPEYQLDSTFTIDSLNDATGWIEVSPSTRGYKRARSFNNVRMHYNDCIAPTLLRVYQNGEVIHEDSLIADGAQHSVKLSFATTPGQLKYEFTGKISPNICGFSLEGDYGVQVSNIGMRGSSGTVFSRMNQSTLGTMYRELNTELVIMQYGGNSVPFFKDSASVRNFASYFKTQINTIKRLNPSAMVIVIGPSDMSHLSDGIYNTYEFLPYCVEQMIEAAKSTGSAYWNLYAAMGGKNSMPSWVEQGLAGKDYIHFSNSGAKFASQSFYNALIAAYNKWKTTH